MSIKTTGLYRSIHAEPEAVRELLRDWDGPNRAAEGLVRTQRVLLAGIGTSFHATIIGEYLLRVAQVDAWSVRSFELVTYPRPLRSDDGVVIISHRGSKQYSSKALQRAVEAGVVTVGITGKNTKMQGADIIIETVDQDPSSTNSISYIGALTRLGQIAVRLAALKGLSQEAQRLEQGLERLPRLMEGILAREEEVRRLAQEAVAQNRRIYFVGAGPNAATASEAALKAKEASYVTTEGFELEQCLHGPQVAFEKEDLIIPISVGGAARERFVNLLLNLGEIDPRVWLIGEAPDARTAELFDRPGWARFGIADGVDLPEEVTPLLTALPVQLLSAFLAEARGTNADSFRKDQEVYDKAYQHLAL